MAFQAELMLAYYGTSGAKNTAAVQDQYAIVIPRRVLESLIMCEIRSWANFADIIGITWQCLGNDLREGSRLRVCE